MTRLNRREFIQASTASLLLDSVKVPASPGGPGKINETTKSVRVEEKNYTWEWSPKDDRFRLLDKRKRPVNPFRSFPRDSRGLYSVTAEHDRGCGILIRGDDDISTRG